ncbi:MAG: hypothetical protein OXI51_06995 [Chloroflexota bacterium]|nr:hypothetical protein [Chloroflexota bacterium]
MAEAERTPIEEFLRILNALGEIAEPPVRAYLRWCESPAGKQVAHVANTVPALLPVILLAALAAREDEDGDALPRWLENAPECVWTAWLAD